MQYLYCKLYLPDTITVCKYFFPNCIPRPCPTSSLCTRFPDERGRTRINRNQKGLSQRRNARAAVRGLSLSQKNRQRMIIPTGTMCILPNLVICTMRIKRRRAGMKEGVEIRGYNNETRAATMAIAAANIPPRRSVRSCLRRSSSSFMSRCNLWISVLVARRSSTIAARASAWASAFCSGREGRDSSQKLHEGMVKAFGLLYV